MPVRVRRPGPTYPGRLSAGGTASAAVPPVFVAAVRDANGEAPLIQHRPGPMVKWRLPPIRLGFAPAPNTQRRGVCPRLHRLPGARFREDRSCCKPRPARTCKRPIPRYSLPAAHRLLSVRRELGRTTGGRKLDSQQPLQRLTTAPMSGRHLDRPEIAGARS